MVVHRLGVAGGQLRVNLKGFASFPSGSAVYAIGPYDSIVYIF